MIVVPNLRHLFSLRYKIYREISADLSYSGRS